MNKALFREKSLQKLRTPEQLDEYICVSRPSVWLLLIGILVLLIGACVWGLTGQVDSAVDVIVCVDGEDTVCYVSEDDAEVVKVGQTVDFSGEQSDILEIVPQDGIGNLCVLTPIHTLPDGLYKGRIVLQSYRPISFITN